MLEAARITRLAYIKGELVYLNIRPYGKIWSPSFLFIRSYGHKLGPSVFYLFGPPDSVYRTSSILYAVRKQRIGIDIGEREGCEGR